MERRRITRNIKDMRTELRVDSDKNEVKDEEKTGKIRLRKLREEKKKETQKTDRRN